MKNLLTLTLIFVLLGTFLLFWIARPEYALQQAVSGNGKTGQAPKADSYMRGIEMNTYSKEGNLEFNLQAQEANFFKNDNLYILEQPHLTAFDAKNPTLPWELTAKTGRMFNNGNRIVFNGDVRLWQLSGLDELKELTSPDMTLFPQKKLAETDSRVKIQTPHVITHGTGMSADLSRETFTLLHNVSGTHDGQ